MILGLYYGQEQRDKREGKISRKEGDINRQALADVKLGEKQAERENYRLRQHNAKGVKLVGRYVNEELQQNAQQHCEVYDR